MKRLRLILCMFLLLLLSGCGGITNSALAFYGLWGTYIVFAISLLTLFVFKLFRIKNRRKYVKEFIKNHKLLLWILLFLFIFNFLFINVIAFAKSIKNPVKAVEAFFENFSVEDNFGNFGLISSAVLAMTSISNAVYSLLLLVVLRKSERYSFLVPIIITALYVLTLLYVFFYDNNNRGGLLMIWVWPLFLIQYILR